MPLAGTDYSAHHRLQTNLPDELPLTSPSVATQAITVLSARRSVGHKPNQWGPNRRHHGRHVKHFDDFRVWWWPKRLLQRPMQQPITPTLIAFNAAWGDPNTAIYVHGYDSTGSVQDGGCNAMNFNNYSSSTPGRQFYSFHTGGVNAVRCDGSVSFISQSINTATLAAVISKSGGEVLNSSQFNERGQFTYVIHLGDNASSAFCTRRGVLPDYLDHSVNDYRLQLANLIVLASVAALS